MLKSDVLDYYQGPERNPGRLRPHFRVAEVLGCTPEYVLLWPDVVPEFPAFKLHVLTGGALVADPELYAKMKIARRRKNAAAKKRERRAERVTA